MSQSLVNESSGARTPLSGLVAALLTRVVVLFFTGLLSALPQPVLAAIVLVAVTGLIQIEAMKHIWRFSRAEFAVAVVALFGVLGSGLLNGVLFGAVLSIVLLLGRASRPRVVEIGRVPGTSYFADLLRHPENERIPDVLVVRLEGALLYFNTDHVRDRLTALVSRRVAPPRLIVLFMGTSPFIDLAGTEMLIDLHAGLRAKGITFRLAEAHGQVREALHRVGHEEAAGLAETHATVDDVVNAWRASSGHGLAAAS
jgi:MFS superfamily sulfate permease-like transporter